MEQEDGSLGSEGLGKKECKAGRKEALTFSKLAVEAKMSKNLKSYDKFQVFLLELINFPHCQFHSVLLLQYFIIVFLD